MKSKILIKNHEYLYSIKKSNNAKYIRLQVSGNGEIELIIPKRVSIERGVLFVESKRVWLEKRIKKVGQCRNKFRYLGEEITLSLEYHLFIDRYRYIYKDRKLRVIIPSGVESTEKDFFEDWLFEEAKVFIEKRVEEIAEKYNFNYNRVKVKRLKSRWGSCSSKKNLSFNYKLLSFDRNVIDYVIIHELCHLKEMNHSKNFWNNVEMLLPEYRELKKVLSN